MYQTDVRGMPFKLFEDRISLDSRISYHKKIINIYFIYITNIEAFHVRKLACVCVTWIPCLTSHRNKN
jgi:hypothetical protein